MLRTGARLSWWGPVVAGIGNPGRDDATPPHRQMSPAMTTADCAFARLILMRFTLAPRDVAK
jgi:hypothetical protein